MSGRRGANLITRLPQIGDWTGPEERILSVMAQSDTDAPKDEAGGASRERAQGLKRSRSLSPGIGDISESAERLSLDDLPTGAAGSGGQQPEVPRTDSVPAAGAPTGPGEDPSSYPEAALDPVPPKACVAAPHKTAEGLLFMPSKKEEKDEDMKSDEDEEVKSEIEVELEADERERPPPDEPWTIPVPAVGPEPGPSYTYQYLDSQGQEAYISLDGFDGPHGHGPMEATLTDPAVKSPMMRAQTGVRTRPQ